MLSRSSRSNSGGYLRDYRPQWTSFFSPFPVVTQSASSTGAVIVTVLLSKMHATHDTHVCGALLSQTVTGLLVVLPV